MTGTANYSLAVKFRQTVNKVMAVRSNTKILRQVYYTQLVGDNGRLHEFRRLAVRRTAEQHVDVGQRPCRSETQAGFPDKPLMDIAHQVSGIRLTGHPHNFNIRMVNQQSYKLACRISGTTYYTCLYHASRGLSLRCCTA